MHSFGAGLIGKQNAMFTELDTKAEKKREKKNNPQKYKQYRNVNRNSN